MRRWRRSGARAAAVAAFLAVPLAAIPGARLRAAGPPAAAGLAFVVNSAEASLSVIDITTGQELRRIPVQREPHHMALSPDHASLLVGDTVGNTVYFLDPRSGAVQRQVTISDPYQLQFSPDGKWLVVNGLARNQVDIYDAASLQLAHRVALAAMPSHANFTPDSKIVFVSLQRTNRLAAIEVASGRVLWNVDVGATPAGVLFHDGEVLVGLMGDNAIGVVDAADGHIRRRIPTGRGAHNLFLSPDGRFIYATNRVDSTISVLDAHTLHVERSFAVSGGPDDLDFAPDGMIWATRRFAHSVAIIDPVSGTWRVIPAGRSPHGIWLNTHDSFPPAGAAAPRKLS